MLNPDFFIKTLEESQIVFFTGVPDSLLKNICAYIADNVLERNNIVAANEGGAMGLAVGYYLSTGKIPVVYMQNSGEGNIVNPLLSLTDADVYNIPVLLLIGWRGEPGIKDEPQHKKQGKVTLELLKAMGVKYAVLSKDEVEARGQIESAVAYMTATKEAFALVVRKDTFASYNLSSAGTSAFEMSRESAIKICADALEPDDIVVSTTGMISRELFEYRAHNNLGHHRDFLTVGAMGHASQIALGIALQKSSRKVFVFDGDGAAIMHMGAMAISASMQANNFYHIIFNNGAHDSVGGQPTIGFKIDFCRIAEACGYKRCFCVKTETELKTALAEFVSASGPVLLEVRVKKGNRADLGRPTKTPVENKEAFMKFLGK